MGNIAVAAVFTVVALIMFRYAPADTKQRPLVGARTRERIRMKAVGWVVLLGIVTLQCPDPSIKLCITLGAVCQCFSILPLTYKVLGRSGRNYESYEFA